jgi:transposase
MGRAEVALFCNVDEKTVLEWIKRFNAEGIDGLADRPRGGAPRCIAKEEMITYVIPLLDDPGRANEEHWTAVKLRGYLVRECSVEASYPTLVRYLHEFSRALHSFILIEHDDCESGHGCRDIRAIFRNRGLSVASSPVG